MREGAFMLSTILGIYSISVAGKFLDATVDILHSSEPFSFQAYFVSDSFQYLLWGLILWCIMSMLDRLRDYLGVLLEGDFYFKADRELIEKISKANLQEVEEKEFQNLLSYVPFFSTWRIVDTYYQFSNTTIQLISFFGSFLMLFSSMGLSSLLLIVFVLPETILEFIRNDQIRKYADDNIHKIKFMNYIKTLTTRVPEFPELRVDGIFSYLSIVFRTKGEEYYKGYYDRNFHLYTDKALLSVVDQVLLTVYIVYILAVSIAKKVTIGDFSASVNYARTAYGSAYQIISRSFTTANNLSYVKSFFELLDYEGFGDVSTGSAVLQKGCPTLEFQNLDFAYPGHKGKVLENITLTIKPGEKVAFVGNSGSGKTSLVKILCGLFAITAGDYVVGGYSVRELARGELKNRVSVLFQDFVRYNFTLKRNIVLGHENKKINQTLYERSKEIAGVNAFIEKEGINEEQVLGKFLGTRELSPGHWQRLAIARMIYRNRDIMIMDEPFTFIDGPSRASILDGIIDFVGNDKILIYITQDTDYLDKFDKIYYFKEGSIVEEGTSKELIRKKGLFYKEVKFNR